MKIRVKLTNGDLRYHTLPLGLRVSEIVGWLDDKYGGYGWIDYDEL